MEDISLVRSEVERWRRAHRGRRGPLPLELRRRVGVLAARLGHVEVARALDLKPQALRAWALRYGRAGRARRADRGATQAAFVEVGQQLAVALHAAPGGREDLSVELAGPAGATLRLQGPVGPDLVTVLAHIVLGRTPQGTAS